MFFFQNRHLAAFAWTWGFKSALFSFYVYKLLSLPPFVCRYSVLFQSLSMSFKRLLLSSFLLLCSFLISPISASTYGSRLIKGDLVQRQATTTSQAADPGCTNGPNTRACWSDGYSIATNYDSNWPVTGVTRSYTLEITNQTLAPDGFSKIVLGVNGGTPGVCCKASEEFSTNKYSQRSGLIGEIHYLLQLPTSWLIMARVFIGMDFGNGILTRWTEQMA